jgi:leader peptidase (prepilin peptidase) / N-methyltransferase
MTTTTLTTTVRVTRAWAAGTTTIRRAAVAACLTSLVQALYLPVPLAFRLGLGLAGCLIAAAALVDVHELRLPNPMVGGALVASLVSAALTSQAWLLRSLTGMLIAGGLMLAVRLHRGVGMGDVKLAAAVGAGTGSVAVTLAPLAIAIAALVAGCFGIATGRRRLPLGPALWLGWSTSLLVAPLGDRMGWW